MPNTRLSSIVLAGCLLAPLCAQEAPSQPTQLPESSSTTLEVSKWGALQHLSKDTEAVWNVYQLPKHLNDLFDSGFGKTLDILLEEEGVSLQEMKKTEEYQMFSSLTKEEVFMASGKGYVAASEIMAGYSASSTATYARIMAGVSFYLSHDDFGAMQKLVENVWSDMLMHERLGVKKVVSLKVPPTMLGFKVSNGIKRKLMKHLVAEKLNEFVTEFPHQEAISRYEGEHKGQSHQGLCIHLDALLEHMDQQAEEMRQLGVEVIAPAVMATLLEGFKGRKIYLTVSEHEGYLIFFIGESMQQLRFADKVQQSVMARPELSYLKDYAKKEVIAHYYEQESHALSEADMVKESAQGMLSLMRSNVDVFGEVGDVEKAYQRLKGNAAALEELKLRKPLRAVMMRDRGIVVEMAGGTFTPNENRNAINPLTKLDLQSSTLFSAFWSVDPKVHQETISMMKNIADFSAQTLRVTQKASANMPDNAEWQPMLKQMVKAIPSSQQCVEAVCDAVSNGLGDHRALVIDLEGSFPQLPGVPEPLLKRSKIPRVTWLSSIKDKAQLSKQWGVMEENVKQLLDDHKDGGEEGGRSLLPDLVLDQTETGSFYSYPIPGSHQNFRPSIGIQDKVWMMTSAPAHGQQLLKKPSNRAADNFSMRFDCEQMGDYMVDWIALIDREGQATFGEHAPDNSFREYRNSVRPVMVELAEVLLNMDPIDYRAEMKDGQLVHKVRVQTKVAP